MTLLESMPKQWFMQLFNLNKNKSQVADNVVHPCNIEGQDAIVYKSGLRERNPVFYAQLTKFANENNIFLKEDQRDSFNTVKNDRRSRFMPMMVLGASLLTNQTVAAANKNIDAGYVDFKNGQNIEYQVNHLNKSFTTNEQKNIEKLLGWVSGQLRGLGVEVNNEMPDIQRVSSKSMLKIAFGKDIPRAVNQKNMQIYGLYNFKNKTVYLLDSIDLETEKGKSVLLHELVHYVQYQNGHDKKVNCKNELENLAYHLEARYLQEHGEHVDFSQNHVDRVSQCG